PALTLTVRADVGARQIHRALLHVVVANEPGLRANLDTEFLHDFRVALRRMRSLLSQIKQVFPDDVVEHFSNEFSWIGRVTGPSRDMDVLLLALRSKTDIAPGDMQALTAFVEQTRQQEHRRVVEALDSERYRRLVTQWEAFLEQPAQHEQEPR